MTRDANSIIAAALPQPYRILGLRLRPFSLGHYLLLSRHDCAFVASESRPATRADLVLACLVCSMRFDEFEAWIEPRPVRWTDRLRAALSFSPTLILSAFRHSQAQFDMVRWGRAVGPVWSFDAKVRLFLRYMEESSRTPKYWIEREDGRGSGAHWAQNVLNLLTGELGFTRTESLDMPLAEALLHFFAAAERLGAVRLMTEDELDITEPIPNGCHSTS